MPEPVDEYSVAALRDFASQLPHISRLPGRAASNAKMGIRAILNNLTLPQDLDLRDIDVEDLLDQFEDETADRFTIHTRQTYRTAFRRGLALFLRWKAHDPAWDSDPSGRVSQQSGSGRSIMHAFPIRAGMTTRFALPVDLTGNEADRLVTFIRSLVVQRPLQQMCEQEAAPLHQGRATDESSTDVTTQ